MSGATPTLNNNNNNNNKDECCWCEKSGTTASIATRMGIVSAMKE